MRKLVAAIAVALALVAVNLGVVGLRSGPSRARADDGVSPDANGNLTITVAGNAFDPKSVTAAAGQSLNVTFQDDDMTTIHNLVFYDASGQPIVSFDYCSGGCAQALSFNAPSAPGTYSFKCQVHTYLGMSGTLTVQ